jgi:hypothetical protein
VRRVALIVLAVLACSSGRVSTSPVGPSRQVGLPSLPASAAIRTNDIFASADPQGDR